MNIRGIVFFVLATITTIEGCSNATRRINPPNASIQQLTVEPDGRWRIQVRIQNFSTVSMHYSALNANLKVNDVDISGIALSPNLEIAPQSADILETTLKMSTKIPSKDFDYQLKGTIDTSEPKGHYPFEHKSRLSPVPGLLNTYR